MSRGRNGGRARPGVERLLKGALAGAVAWEAMDVVLSLIYDAQRADVRKREDQARGGVPALEAVAERLAAQTGVRLSPEERQRSGKRLQRGMGVGAGMLYGMLRAGLPGRGLPRGLLYGAAFSLLVDEALTPALGFAPGPLAFPWQTHARGLAGHLVYGIVLEAAMHGLDGSFR